MEEMPVERSLYRALERAGKYFPVLLDRHQNLIAKHGLVDPNQLIDLTLFLRRKLSGRLKNVLWKYEDKTPRSAVVKLKVAINL